MWTIINQKHVMSDNSVCFFETSDRILQDNLDSHSSYRYKMSKKVSALHPLVLDWLLQQVKAFQIFHSLEIQWKMITVIQKYSRAGVAPFILKKYFKCKSLLLLWFIQSSSWTLPFLPMRIYCYRNWSPVINK